MAKPKQPQTHDLREIRRRILTAVASDDLLVVFDWKFGPRPKPPVDAAARWGGYRAEFKLIGRELFRNLGGDVGGLRRQSVEIGPGHQRIFQIDISKFEFR